MKGVGSHHRTLSRRAWCLVCKREWTAQNALAVAAQHAAAHGHTTRAEITTEHAYVPEPVQPW